MAKLHCAVFYDFERENEYVIYHQQHINTWGHVPRFCRLSPFSRGQSQLPPIRISSPVHNVHAARFRRANTAVWV